MALFFDVMSFLAIADTLFIVDTLFIASNECEEYI